MGRSVDAKSACTTEVERRCAMLGLSMPQTAVLQIVDQAIPTEQANRIEHALAAGRQGKKPDPALIDAEKTRGALGEAGGALPRPVIGPQMRNRCALVTSRTRDAVLMPKIGHRLSNIRSQTVKD
jgi:hypothetical protein